MADKNAKYSVNSSGNTNFGNEFTTNKLEAEFGGVNYREKVEKIKEVISMLRDDGAYDDLTAHRTRKEHLKKHYKNVFDADVNLTSRTKRTMLFKSYIVRTCVEVVRRKLKTIVFDIEPVSKAKVSYEEKTQSSMAKAVVEWLMRAMSYENIDKESTEDQIAFGDRYLRPFVRQRGEKHYPGLENIDSDCVMIDPNARNVYSESYSDQAQYIAVTLMYPEKNLIREFGKWITEYAVPGYMVDSARYPGKNLRSPNNKYYEVLWVQDIAEGEEYLLVGGNAFPMIMRGCEEEAPEEIKSLIEDQEKPVVWDNEYLYKDSFEENRMIMTNAFCYFDQDSPRNFGIVDKLAILQVIHEITQNSQIDNMLKRLDQIAFLIGGNYRTDKTLQEYRKEKLTNRDAIWNIPGTLGKNPPQPGVIKFDGLTAQEGDQIDDTVHNMAKNMVGVDPRQLEVQKNTAVTQTQIIEEKSVESVEDIAELNISNKQNEIKTFLDFFIAHEGFGLDVKINFTKYEELTPEGNRNATITLRNAAKKLKGFEYDVIIDRSSYVKRSRFLEREQLIEFLQLINPQVTPEWFIEISKQIAHISGLSLPEVQQQMVEQMTPTGGNSQFQDKNAPNPRPSGKPQPQSIPQPSQDITQLLPQ